MLLSHVNITWTAHLVVVQFDDFGMLCSIADLVLDHVAPHGDAADNDVILSGCMGASVGHLLVGVETGPAVPVNVALGGIRSRLPT